MIAFQLKKCGFELGGAVKREIEKERAVGNGSLFHKAFGLGEEAIQYLIEFKAFSLSPPRGGRVRPSIRCAHS
ncbi:MAG: hypothetical protein CMI17_02875 [Opitutaceae bacterium]|nr:hypothetical protein [Opitutaceae bacterium]